MALFKIEKGTAAKLTANRKNANEGFCYFTTDDGKFYIDIAGDGSNNTPAVIGTNRICLNAANADTANGLKNSLLFKVNGVDNKSFNGVTSTTINFKNGNGIGISVDSTDAIVVTNQGVTEIKGEKENGFRTGSITITAINIMGSTGIGNSTTPIYWNGTSF